MQPPSATPSNALFKWLCLLIAAGVGGFLCWSVNDLRLDVRETTAAFKQTADKLNNELPRILANTKASTETIGALTRDVNKLRKLAAPAGGTRDETLVQYADELLNLIDEQDAKIGKKKLVGRQLKDPMTAKERFVGDRREALAQAFRVRSRQQMLEKLTKTLTGGHWYILFGDDEPQTLIDWAKEKHPETAKLFSETKSK